MKFLKDYEFDLQYYPGKAKAVADALSRKATEIVASLMIAEWSLIKKVTRSRIGA